MFCGVALRIFIFDNLCAKVHGSFTTTFGSLTRRRLSACSPSVVWRRPLDLSRGEGVRVRAVLRLA